MHETSVDTSLHSTGELVLPLDPNTEGHSPPCDVLPTNDGPKDGPAHTQNMAPNTGHTCPICPTKSFATSTILWQHINNSHAVRSIFPPASFYHTHNRLICSLKQCHWAYHRKFVGSGCQRQTSSGTLCGSPLVEPETLSLPFMAATVEDNPPTAGLTRTLHKTGPFCLFCGA